MPRLKNREEFGEGKKKGKREKKKEEKKTGVRVSTGENYLKFASLLMKIYHGMIRKQSKYIYLPKQGIF